MFKIYEDWDDVVILKIPRLRINEEGKLAGCGQDYIETHYPPSNLPYSPPSRLKCLITIFC